MSDTPGALRLAIKFHETYERLAPTFGYETRKDTRRFDPASNNGRLMIAVCEELHAEVEKLRLAQVGERKCSNHPDAPHGFNRNASHNAGRYVCDCESWRPSKRRDYDCCANCLCPSAEHNEGKCPAPYTTVWHKWDYACQPDGYEETSPPLQADACKVPPGFKLVPSIGTRVRADHPVTCLNPEEWFEVTEVRAETDGRFYARGENTCWFGVSMLSAAPTQVETQGDKP